VRCFYVETETATLVVDPLVPDDDAERFWRALDRDVERRALPLSVVLTQAAHARSAAEVAARYGADVWGHDYARGKVGDARFHSIASGDVLPGEARVLEFDQEPGGSGTPLYFPSHRALAVGDVFISVNGELRIWWEHGASRDTWYRARLVPSLRRWLALEIERVLVAHGDEVAGGAEEIAAALERDPYDLM
jgi:glyoxylase-like metal-dependent hydrolase (beta-lactamase superfamily II)